MIYRSRIKYIFIMPAVLVLLLITVFPLIYSIYLSFHSLAPGRPAIFVGGENYLNIFTSIEVLNSFKVTFIYTVVVVAIEFLFGLGLALLMNARERVGHTVSSLIILPMLMSPIVAGFLWRALYDPQRGSINLMLTFLGLEGRAWLGDINTALYAVMLVDIWQWTPFVFLVFFAGLKALPLEPYQAIQLDGASRWQTFCYLTFPLLKPVILFVILFRAMDAFRVFDTVYALTMGGPGMSTEVISLHIYKNAFRFSQIGEAAAQAWVVALGVLVFSQLLLKFFSTSQRG